MKLCIWPKYELRDGGFVVPLARHEGLIMTALLGRRECTLDLLREVLWPHPDDEADTWHNVI